MATRTTTAIVSSGSADPSTWKPGNNWSHTTIAVPTEPAEGDVLIEMAASGICYSDLTITAPPNFSSPRVVGHEGSGYVKAIGSGVRKDLKVGDPVLLSFDDCGACENCRDEHPAYCTSFIGLNIPCVPGVFKNAEGKEGIAGKSFGQSSFAALSVVKEACILNARDLARPKKELQLFAPLGCGYQTGAGAVLNLAKPGKRDRVIVMSLGGVGLSAVLAAVISGRSHIIAVDRVPSRIDLAKSFRATHGLNTRSRSRLQRTDQRPSTYGRHRECVLRFPHWQSVSDSPTATARVPLLTAGLASLAPRGTLVTIGASNSPAEYNFTYDVSKHMGNGTRAIGCIEGDANPADFIPQLIQYHREGKFPLDKMAKFYKAEDFETAVNDMHTGETIKPILT